MRSDPVKNILVLGASGLIGHFISADLRARGFAVTGVARRFAPGQKLASFDHELPIMALGVAQLADLLRSRQIDLVVNCLGVLQDGPGMDTQAVHCDFVARLLQAICDCRRPVCLVHISIPGEAADDCTSFSYTKREAERLIMSSGVRYAILRPGFVIAPSAYGGGAMLRALAMSPFDLAAADAVTPFQPVAASDIAATVAWLATGEIPPNGGVVWDLMQPQLATLGDVVAEFRRAFGVTDSWRVRCPAAGLDLAAKLGDLSSLLGWASPMRSTAIAELRRGVKGDPSSWMAATGIEPVALPISVGRGGASIQEKWFARLYLLKALMIISLSVFWVASGFIALFVSYSAAAGIFASHRFPAMAVAPLTIGSSLIDISIGILIGIRRTSAAGLIAGILVALGYMTGATLLAPDLWIEPLGALVKTGPAIVLMLVTLSMLDNR